MKKTCILTGGSSGIGLAIAKAFLDNDYIVHNLDISESEFGHFHQCDVTNHQQVQQIIQDIAANGPIDVLVANAGIHVSANIENTSYEQLERVLSINVKGAYSALQAVLPSMKARNKGSIVLMGSDQSFVGKTNSFAYNISKAAIASMAKTTALDYAEFNICANAVCPGTIDTPLYRKALNNYCERTGADPQATHKEWSAEQPLNRIGEPEEVADLVLFLASDKARFITGSLHAIDGGYTTQ